MRSSEKLKIAQQSLPKGVTINPVYDRTELVDKALSTAERALLEGSILVAVVLFLFLGEIRSAIVVIVTLPLAMLIAFIPNAAVWSLGQSDVAGGLRYRHRHDGRRRSGDGGEQLPAAGARCRIGKPVDRTHIILKAAREVMNPIAFAIADHHRRVPAALLAHRAGRQTLQPDGAHHHLAMVFGS